MPRGDLSDQVCKVGEEDAARRFFEVNVVRACDLTGDCDSASAQGVVYNRRHQIRDPKAIVYVADVGQRCAGDACDELEQAATRIRCWPMAATSA